MHDLTVVQTFEHSLLVGLRQTLGVEIVPRLGPLVRERLQTQFPAARDRGLIAAVEFHAVHAEFLDLRHGRRRRRVLLLGPVALQETLPKPVLKQNYCFHRDRTRGRSNLTYNQT